jgi:hypothetical protein
MTARPSEIEVRNASLGLTGDAFDSPSFASALTRVN